MLLIEMFRDVSRLAKFTPDAERFHVMADARLCQPVRNLRPHACHDLMIFQGHDATRAGSDHRADGVEINAIYERIVQDCGADLLIRKPVLSR